MKSFTNRFQHFFFATLISILFLINLSANASSKDDFTSACTLYGEKHYKEALNTFLQISQRNEVSPALFKNIGNCYFKLNEYHLAILFYEKGLKLEPNNEDLRYNLSLANTKIIDKIDALPKLFIVNWWDSIVELQNEKSWTIFSLLLFAIFLLFVGLFVVHSNSKFRKFYFFSAVTTLTLGILVGFISFSSYQKQINFTEAIIISPSIDIKSSPDYNSKTIFILHQGTKVELKDKINDWYEIKIANGNLGWAKKSDFEKI